MRFAFSIFVICISSCVCASSDLDIFGGWKYDEPRGHRSISNNHEDDDEVPVSRFYKDYINRELFDRELLNKIPQRIKDIEEMMNQRKKQFRAKAQAQTQSYLRFRDVFSDPEEYEYRKAILDQPFDRLHLAPANQPMLDDVRPYPREDSDFTFRDDVENDFDQESNLQDNLRYDTNNEEDFEVLSHEQLRESTPNIQNVDDPSLFAYAPSDPRYFEDNVASQSAPKLSFAKPPADDGLRKGSQFLNRRNDNEDMTTNKEIIEDVIEPAQRVDIDGVTVRKQPTDEDTTGVYIIAMVAGVSAAATVGLIAFGIGWYNLQKHVKNASDVEYPAYGVTGPNKEVSPSGDRRLAQSAQMYHYQHQKQQIIAMENRAAANERHGSVSEAESDEENEEGDYTVYECPGLAPTGEMEVKNPLFQDDPTPAQTPAVKSGDTQKK